jgi:DNA-binding phage protein
MKRKAIRIHREISPEKEAEIRRISEQILREEKAELSAMAREAFKEYDAAKAELARAAELLKAERTKQGLSLTDIEGRTGIHRAALCRLENLVEANPKIATLERIAQALGKRLIVGLED